MRFLVRVALAALGNAIGLIAAAAILDQVSLNLAGLLLDVVVFTVVSAIALPAIQKQAIRRSEALAGSSALVTCFIALVVTVWWSDGLRISGVSGWVLATIIVWAGSLAAGILLPWLLVRRRV